MEPGDFKKLVQRLKEQGWDQGSILPWRADLFLVKADEPLTSEAERVQVREGDLGVVFEPKVEPEQMVIISQRCDIVSPAEPLVEALPVVRWPAKQPLPGANSTRYFIFDVEERLVADARRKLLFEKTLFPDGDAEQLCGSDQKKRAFAAWCARRYSRVAFPDDFVITVGAALETAIRGVAETTDPRDAIHSWRVAFTEEDDGSTGVSFLVPYDEQHEAAEKVTSFVEAVAKEAKKILPEISEKALERAQKRDPEVTFTTFKLVSMSSVPSEHVSLRDLRDFPAFNLEHMTYEGEQVVGVEPHEEALA